MVRVWGKDFPELRFPRTRMTEQAICSDGLALTLNCLITFWGEPLSNAGTGLERWPSG